MWDEFLFRLGRDEVFALSMLTLMGIIAVTAIAVVQWRKIRQAEIDASLKREMVSRGMSAQDILAVLGAPAANHRAEPSPPPADLHAHAQQFANEIRDNVRQVLNKVAAKL
jgi:hypothetical protein